MRPGPSTRALVLSLLLAGPASVSGAERIPILLLGDDAYPPFSYAGKDGNLEGIYPGLLRKLAAMLPDYAIELRPVPWKRALHEVEKGYADGVFPPYRKPELRPWMRYSEPLLNEVTVVLCHRDVASRYRNAPWPAGYAGARFGNNSGFVLAGKAFFDMATAGTLYLQETQSTEQNLRMLSAGRIDCYPNERHAIDTEIKLLGLNAAQFVETGVIANEQGYVGYGEAATTGTPVRDRFIRELDAAIRKLRASGQLQAEGFPELK